MMENFQVLLLQTEERRQQEAEERKRETDDVKALIQEQKQIQEHSTAELGLIRGCLLYTSIYIYIYIYIIEYHVISW